MPRFLKPFMAQHRISPVFQLDCFVKLCYSSLNSAGKGLANPTALLLSSLMMLRSVHAVLFNISTQLIMPIRHMKLYDHANRIEKAALTVRFQSSLKQIFDHIFFLQTIAEGKSITGDLGGKASTTQYTDAIIQKL